MKKITLELDDKTYDNLYKIYENTIKSNSETQKITFEEFICNILNSSFSWNSSDSTSATNNLIDSLKNALKNLDPNKLEDLFSNFAGFGDLFADTKKETKQADKKQSDSDLEAMKKKS